MASRTYPAKTELEALREKIKPFQDAFDLLDDHVVITDSNGVILYANKAVERNTGYSPEETLGKNPGDLWGGDMPQEFYETMWRTIKTEKKPFVGEVHNTRKEGSRYWQEVHISPILDEKGNVRFFIGIEPTITDRKEKERFREEFVSMIGHQLRNPLTTIRWTIELLSRSARLNEEDKRNLESIYNLVSNF